MTNARACRIVRGMRATFNLIDDARARLLLETGFPVSYVAKDQGVSRQAIYQAIRKGRLPAPLKKPGK